MANKANQTRTRIIRSALLSASVLSILPLVGVMQQGATDYSNLDAMATAPDIGESATATDSTLPLTFVSTTQATETTSVAAATPAAQSTAAVQTQTQTQTQARTGYTRTTAS